MKYRIRKSKGEYYPERYREGFLKARLFGLYSIWEPGAWVPIHICNYADCSRSSSLIELAKQTIKEHQEEMKRDEIMWEEDFDPKQP